MGLDGAGRRSGKAPARFQRLAGRPARDVAGEARGDLHALSAGPPGRRSRGRGDRLEAVGDLRRSGEPAARAEGDPPCADERPQTLAMTYADVRHTRGLLVVILLGLIFVALLAALIVFTGRRPTTSQSHSETLSVLPQRIRIRTDTNAK